MQSRLTRWKYLKMLKHKQIVVKWSIQALMTYRGIATPDGHSALSRVRSEMEHHFRAGFGDLHMESERRDSDLHVRLAGTSHGPHGCDGAEREATFI
jgi:hypothetical protein